MSVQGGRGRQGRYATCGTGPPFLSLPSIAHFSAILRTMCASVVTSAPKHSVPSAGPAAWRTLRIMAPRVAAPGAAKYLLGSKQDGSAP